MITRIFGIILSAQLLISNANAFQPKDEVLIAGDSWASFMCVYKSFDSVFQSLKVRAKTNSDCLRTTQLGMSVHEWLGSDQDDKTKLSLINHPRIRVLVLSLGGNDLISGAHRDMTHEEEIELHAKIQSQLKKAIKIYREIRPDVRIIVSGYDYPRFGNDNRIPQYRKIYRKMGEPTPSELNAILIRFSQSMVSLNDGNHVFYGHHLGLMHYYYGVPEAGLRPRVTAPPAQIGTPDNPLAFGGDISLRAADRAMLNVGSSWLTDAFHLGRTGFSLLARHTYDLYLRGILKKK